MLVQTKSLENLNIEIFNACTNAKALRAQALEQPPNIIQISRFFSSTEVVPSDIA